MPDVPPVSPASQPASSPPVVAEVLALVGWVVVILGAVSLVYQITSRVSPSSLVFVAAQAVGIAATASLLFGMAAAIRMLHRLLEVSGAEMPDQVSESD